MIFAYPSQRLQDWLSQQWCICTGRRIDPDETSWLMGPYGNVDVIEDRFVDLLATQENLRVVKNAPGAGITESFAGFNLPDEELARLNPAIVDFYENTLDYDFEVWSQWCQFFRPFGGLISWLYSKRLQQLNLPLAPLDTSRGIRNQIYQLIDPKTSETKYTIWYRILKSKGDVIYSGIYTQCTMPDGQTFMKAIFPLPRGNATMIMRIKVREDGSLHLEGFGKKFGDPGLYLLLQDSKGKHWSRYVPSLAETITLYVDPEGVLRTDHVIKIWGARALELHYRMNPIGAGETHPVANPSSPESLAS